MGKIHKNTSGVGNYLKYLRKENNIKGRRCKLCGDENYPLSYGGTDICPACDCGNPYDRIRKLRQENQKKMRND